MNVMFDDGGWRSVASEEIRWTVVSASLRYYTLTERIGGCYHVVVSWVKPRPQTPRK